MHKPVPIDLYDRGYRHLVSVVPPDAPLSPGSKIQPAMRGKTPGRKLANGTWAGYDFLKHEASLEDVQQWVQDGANIGLLGRHFPALDIDCLDPSLAETIQRCALTILGPAPVRHGRAPKCLLPYRLSGEPFARMALLVYPRGKGPSNPSHLVEVLGSGRQYLVHGLHPSGSPYTWSAPLPDPEALTPISREQVTAFFAELQTLLEMLPGMEVERVGDGVIRTAGEQIDQEGLVAPSLAQLEEVVSFIPNDEDTGREEYIRIGYAIKAAWPEDEEAAFSLFADWAASHTGSVRVGGNPETWRSDWSRFHPPYSVGYGWLTSLGRRWGFSDAAEDFEALDAAQDQKAEEENGAIILSDLWCANRVIDDSGNNIRYVPADEKWYVWHQGCWVRDAVNLAQHLCGKTMERLSAHYAKVGGSPQETREAQQQARRLGSAGARNSVLQIVQTDPRCVIRPEAFDADPWVLNTPAGIIDLQTGAMLPHDVARLCSKTTKVAPDFAMATPEWHRFLMETTREDVDLIRYLQRMVGYCLTGATMEQVFWMIWGPGGNGKSVFLNTITGLLGDYARTAPMDTFTASSSDKHPTDVAMLMGARLVNASETQAGKRWDEAKVKSLTGGDTVTARFMRQDFFSFLPQFKLLFIGNHKPELRTVDPAMRRRIHMIPFTVAPRVIDPELPAKLRAEWPGILAWAIRGCLDWQILGLAAPAVVKAATQSYFNEQDAVARWLDECTTADDQGFISSSDLFESWREWAGRNGEFAGSLKGLLSKLDVMKVPRMRELGSRRNGIGGFKLAALYQLEAV